MEKFSSSAKIEKRASEVVLNSTDESEPKKLEAVPKPEYWTERTKTPFSREYVIFQIQVGRELAERSNKSFLEIEGDYLVLPHHYKWPGTDNYIDMTSLSDEQIAEAIYQKEREESEKQGPIPYHDNSRFGCFSYDSHEDGIVDIHFSNEESDDTGPLTRGKIEERFHELSDLFNAIKKEYPDAKEVRGNSWLYNVEAYKRLFPESYTAKLGKDYRDNSLPTDRVWGQFYDSKKELKHDVAEQFLRNIQALDEITPDAVASALPYKVLSTKGPIKDFYAKYGVE
jgi:hypothetical protein